MLIAPLAGEFIQIDGGADHTCALRDDGAIECWGGAYGQRTVITAQLADGFVVVSASDVWDCAINRLGGAECWQAPDDPFTQHWVPDVPQTQLQYTDIAVQYGHACGLTLSGYVFCVGPPFDSLHPISATEGTFFGR